MSHTEPLDEAERPLLGRRNLKLALDWRPYLGYKEQISTFIGHVIDFSWQQQTINLKFKGMMEAHLSNEAKSNC